MVELAKELAQTRDGGYVVAPAGFGKTHLIAAATSVCEGRQLVLTHTHAGVNSIRKKMAMLGVSARSFHVDTIASWSLRLALAYSKNSGWDVGRPTGAQWVGLYRATTDLLDRGFARRIVAASYTGLFVDEYQDCSIPQHELVLKLASMMPARILGDPLQGIFDFDDQDTVNWERDVVGNFERVGTLRIPHRWNKAGSPKLGIWLAEIREMLEANAPVDLTRNRPAEARLVISGTGNGELFRKQSNTCRYYRVDPNETLIAIHRGNDDYKSKCHALAKNLSGKYSSIEEVEGKAVFSVVRKLKGARTDEHLSGLGPFLKVVFPPEGRSRPISRARGQQETGAKSPHGTTATYDIACF